jgi:hypothetical protein
MQVEQDTNSAEHESIARAHNNTVQFTDYNARCISSMPELTAVCDSNELTGVHNSSELTEAYGSSDLTAVCNSTNFNARTFTDCESYTTS